MEALNRAIAAAGSVGALAQAIGVTVNCIYNWRGRQSVGEAQCPAIERATGVPCEELRSDLAWSRVEHPDWPDGKPLLDFLPEEV